MLRGVVIFSAFLCLVAEAYAKTEVNIGVSAGMRQKPKPERIIVVPRYRFDRVDRHIYTPDRYDCGTRKNRKYCVTRKGRPLSGVIVNDYDGKRAYETYQNGFQDGETSVFTPDGTLYSRSYYKDGLKDGTETVYFTNGNVRLVLRYKDGELNGRVEQYDISGVQVGRMTYKKGWFREGACKNEQGGSPMNRRLKEKRYNVIIPCGNMAE